MKSIACPVGYLQTVAGHVRKRRYPRLPVDNQSDEATLAAVCDYDYSLAPRSSICGSWARRLDPAAEIAKKLRELAAQVEARSK
jgi:hypothetical protein